jgi:hypothetical protein
MGARDERGPIFLFQLQEIIMDIKKIVAVGLLGCGLAGCQPNDPPPDIVKTQRDALNKAKAVDDQVMKQAEEQKKAIDDAQK